MSWVLGVVAFVVVRFALAYSALADESRAIVVVFGLLDLGTAVPYALGTARLVTCLVDQRPQAAARWGALASGCFLAPYLWIAWAGRGGEFPTIVYLVTAIFVVSLGANAVLGIRRRVRAEATAAETDAHCEEQAPVDVTDLKTDIDLTTNQRDGKTGPGGLGAGGAMSDGVPGDH